jgi:hypothetical protein
MRQFVVSYSVALTKGVSHCLLSVESQVVQVPVVDRVKTVALGWVVFSSVLGFLLPILIL